MSVNEIEGERSVRGRLTGKDREAKDLDVLVLPRNRVLRLLPPLTKYRIRRASLSAEILSVAQLHRSRTKLS
jgi:hypothetical protein